MTRIAFIGVGNMASALVGGLCRSGVAPTDILAVDPIAEQLERIQKSFGVEIAAGPDARLSTFDIVVWAVKPQLLRTVAGQAAPFTRQALHVSIAAGIRSEDLESWLLSGRVVRAMPNTPALIGEGVCGLFAGTAVTPYDKAQAEAVLASTGKLFWVNSDEAMNAVTAITGSGPAYVFHFLDGLAKSAVALGFNKAQAKDIASSMVLGAARQAVNESAEFRVLQQRVTSKGGTTEAAIDVLNSRRTQEAMLDATRAAFERAKILGSELAR